jgi:hypothetical protein
VALPSAVTLGSVAFVVAAGIGLAAVASNASEDPASQEPSAHDTTKPDTTDQQEQDQPKAKPKSDKKQKPDKRQDPVPRVFVEVYNNSGITGLAATKARELERAGWNVAATDNWYGNIPANTVYYPARLQKSAGDLAKALHITRTRPAVSPMQFDRLTVIYTH